MAKKLIGVDLGGTTIKFAILTENGEIHQGQQRWRRYQGRTSCRLVPVVKLVI